MLADRRIFFAAMNGNPGFVIAKVLQTSQVVRALNSFCWEVCCHAIHPDIRSRTDLRSCPSHDVDRPWRVARRYRDHLAQCLGFLIRLGGCRVSG
jgi:hypothetical protein